MAKELRDLSRVIEKAEQEYNDIDPGVVLREAAYQILARQFLYRHKGRHRKHYEMIVRHQHYFISLLDALNFDLEINEERGYVGILPRDFYRRMSLHATLLLFALRYIYDQELMGFKADEEGCVQTTLEDFDTRCQQLTKRELAKSLPELKNLLDPFTRIGVVDVGPDEERPEIERVKIFPSITALLSGDMVKRTELYMRAEDIKTQDEDGTLQEGGRE